MYPVDEYNVPPANSFARPTAVLVDEYTDENAASYPWAQWRPGEKLPNGWKIELDDLALKYVKKGNQIPRGGAGLPHGLVRTKLIADELLRRQNIYTPTNRASRVITTREYKLLVKATSKDFLEKQKRLTLQGENVLQTWNNLGTETGLKLIQERDPFFERLGDNLTNAVTPFAIVGAAAVAGAAVGAAVGSAAPVTAGAGAASAGGAAAGTAGVTAAGATVGGGASLATAGAAAGGAAAAGGGIAGTLGAIGAGVAGLADPIMGLLDQAAGVAQTAGQIKGLTGELESMFEDDDPTPDVSRPVSRATADEFSAARATIPTWAWAAGAILIVILIAKKA